MKDDEIIKLKMLHDAYEKQKLRVIKLMEIDAKKNSTEEKRMH